MVVDQSNRITGLLLPWSPGDDASGPAHQRLATALRTGINTGRLLPGDRLPPSRSLADDLGLSRWVVTEAYDQLKAEGYLTARVGSGTVVAGRDRAAPTSPPPTSPAPTSPAPTSPAPTSPAPPTPPSGHRGHGPVADSRPTPELLDLSPALPDLTSFPRNAWRTATVRALAGVEDRELGHPDAAGTPALRRTVADYLRRVRAVDADPSQVHVTQGVSNAVWLFCRQLRAAGARRVAVEDPSWPRLREIARSNDLDVVPIPVDGQGLRVAELAQHDDIDRIDAVFVTPTHQFPTGVPMSADRRVALVEWAAAGGRWIVEDDYDAEFRYDRRPVGAVAALAAERVVYLGSVSKTLSPSLHLGWMVAPAALADGLADIRDGMGSMAPTLDQLALVDLITSGAYDRHLRRMRRSYQARRRALLDALVARVPGSPAPSMDAGMHVLWRLPEDLDETAVLDTCRTAGLTILGLSRCRVAPGAAGLVLGYGNVAPHRALAVATLLADAVAAARDTA